MTDVPVYGWILFAAVLLGLLAVDLYVHRGERAESREIAILWSIIWIVVGLAFTVFPWLVFGGQSAQEYLAAYFIEKSLSLDNLFVFLIIFQSLAIPKNHQRTALTWGIFGALAFRAIFVFAGVAALRRWHWVDYIFGGILLIAAWRAFVKHPSEEKESRLVRWLSRHLPVTDDTQATRFIQRRDGKLNATPLLVAIIALELTDIIFAIDSVPAAFSVSRAPFIVYTSNAFAILGLRSLYIVLAKTIAELRYLHYGLAAVLAFAALKLIASRWIEVSPLLSVGIIVALIGSAVGASLLVRKEKGEEEREESEKESQHR